MRHILFEQSDTYEVAVLIKEAAFSQLPIETNYINPLVDLGINKSDLIAFTLEYNDVGKAPVKLIKEYLSTLLPELNNLGTKYLLVNDSNYFKTLTKSTSAEQHYGYVLPCAIKGYEHMNVVLGLNYQAMYYNSEIKSKLDLALKTLSDHKNGKYSVLGQGVIHSAHYPKENHEIKQTLLDLLKYPELSCDIEAFSLKFNKAGIGTISFAWDKHNGVAFPCDYKDIDFNNLDNLPYGVDPGAMYGYFAPNHTVRLFLQEFFENYKGVLKFHNASYDVKVMIYTLWMSHDLDTYGLLHGLEIMTKHFHDTKIIAYLALNSTAGNTLGLKHLAHSFAGNYAKDEIKDIRMIPLEELLTYNLVDSLSTNYVYDKYKPIMRQDNQEGIYHDVLLPSLVDIIQMELTGMPMCPKKIQELKAELEATKDKHLNTMFNLHLIETFNLLLQTDAMDKKNTKLKTRVDTLDKFAHIGFNPNSNAHLQKLLYTQMGLPVIDYTDTKQPATGAETIAKLIHHTDSQIYKDFLEALIAYGKATKILSTFIPAFEEGLLKTDGRMYLHGSFNLGGTVSGRLSSSQPNLQNLPSGSYYGKLVKQAFVAPDGWIFCGADFNSLEDYISALTTKDPNKLAVYEKGFDGHCLRAAYYFRDELLHIDVTDPKSVNTIKKTHPELRQDSKAPTFLLTYGGTYHGMMNNLGWSKEKSIRIETNYHDLYKVSDEYVAGKIKQACVDGYVTVAFGLRVRTPMLKHVIYNSSSMPYEAAAEARTAGNALGQSYCLLNNRAASAFMKKVRASKYKHDIKLVAMIHDAIYLLIKDDIEVVHWVNQNLIECMQWQELPEIQHPTVKLGAALDLYYPDWAHPITLPNNASPELIKQLCKDSVKPK